MARDLVPSLSVRRARHERDPPRAAAERRRRRACRSTAWIFRSSVAVFGRLSPSFVHFLSPFCVKKTPRSVAA